jgi:UDP-glucose:(heptosyl)LPS alpha-1,3-glucosyltransferase
MKFAFCVFKYYPYGGLEKNFLRVLQEVLNRGHSVTVYTMKWEGDVPEFAENNKNFSLEIIKTKGITNHTKCYNYYLKLQELIAFKSFDLKVGFNRMPGLDLYYCADVCFKYDVNRRKSSLFKLTPRYKLYSSFEQSVFSSESKTCILALSHIQKRIYIQEYNTQYERFFDVPAGIDKQRIREALSKDNRREMRLKLGLDNSMNMLLMIGSDFKRKGVTRTLYAIAALPEKLKKQTVLYVLGKGKIKQMLQLANKLKISTNVFFEGGVSNVPDYLAAGDLLVHPALAENTGNAIVESLIAGMPVVATDNCGYAFHIEEAQAGRVVDGENFQQSLLNDAIQQIITLSNSEKANLCNNALNYADNVDFYSRPFVISDIIELLAGRNK